MKINSKKLFPLLIIIFTSASCNAMQKEQDPTKSSGNSGSEIGSINTNSAYDNNNNNQSKQPNITTFNSSANTPLPKQPSWKVKPKNIVEYCQETKSLKEQNEKSQKTISELEKNSAKEVRKISFESIDARDCTSEAMRIKTMKYIVPTSLLQKLSFGQPTEGSVELVPLNDFLVASTDRNNRLIELKKAEEKNILLNNTINDLNTKITDLQGVQSNNLKTNTNLLEKNAQYASQLGEQKNLIEDLKTKQTCANPNDHTNIADLTNQAKQLARIKTAGFWLFGTSTAASLGAAAFTAITKNPNVVFNLFGFSTKHSIPVIATGFTTIGLSSLLIGWRCGFFNSSK